jgi:anti-sigma-K factor RskA
MSAVPRREKALDLLARRALEGLDPLEGAELESLLQEQDDLDADALDLAAAELELAHLSRTGFERPPRELLQRLRALPEVLPSQAAPSEPAPRRLPPPEGARIHALLRASETSASRPLPWVTAGGWITAAALVLLWLLFLAPRPQPPVDALYRELRESGHALAVSWQDQKAGDLVWDNESQEGYMHLVGLERNDPAVSQYQLWIFDAEQLEETPIDGGVFDVTDTDTVVPIHAKLRVRKPYLFAITVEKPGGVPRSAREKIVQVAHVPKTEPVPKIQ